MSCVLTCQFHPHQAVIVPDQLGNTVPKQEEGVAQQLQNTMEHMWALWETREEERNREIAVEIFQKNNKKTVEYLNVNVLNLGKEGVAIPHLWSIENSRRKEETDYNTWYKDYVDSYPSEALVLHVPWLQHWTEPTWAGATAALRHLLLPSQEAPNGLHLQVTEASAWRLGLIHHLCASFHWMNSKQEKEDNWKFMVCAWTTQIQGAKF